MREKVIVLLTVGILSWLPMALHAGPTTESKGAPDPCYEQDHTVNAHWKWASADLRQLRDNFYCEPAINLRCSDEEVQLGVKIFVQRGSEVYTREDVRFDRPISILPYMCSKNPLNFANLGNNYGGIYPNNAFSYQRGDKIFVGMLCGGPDFAEPSVDCRGLELNLLREPILSRE